LLVSAAKEQKREEFSQYLVDEKPYGGWLQNPAPIDRWFIPIFIGFQPSKVVQDFFHPQYVK